MRKFIKNNYIIIGYAIIAIILELLSLGFVGARRNLLTKPLYAVILFLFVISVLYLVKNKIARLVLASFFILAQSCMLVGFAFLYYMNGTVFEWSMLSQRTDAYATLEKIVLEPRLLIPCIVFLVLFTAVCAVLVHKERMAKRAAKKNGSGVVDETVSATGNKQRFYAKIKTAVSLSLCFIFMIGLFLVPFLDSNKNTSYLSYLYDSSGDRYQEIGVSANTVYEALGSINKKVKVSEADYDVLSQKLFEAELETSDYFGVSKGNNLVYVLVESWEWFPIYNDWYDYETAKILYPNLTSFIEQSVVLSNFYQREKTDTAEMLSMVGSNPTGKYINYAFEENELPFSLPNMFRSGVEANGNTVKQIKSFHQNTGSFYNRKALHSSIGFEDYMAIEDMEEYGVENTWDQEAVAGERNADSLTVEKMKGEMFPAIRDGEQFMTFWITFAMHGFYFERESFKKAGYYDLMDELGVLPADISEDDNDLRNYCATVMDFDRALGYMMDELKSKDLLGNTTICLFADHNAYYSNLSYYAKGIEVKKYNEKLYNIPCLIYDQKLRAAMRENGDTVSDDNIFRNDTVIDKFTTTADLIPTMLDIFGIKGWENLYFGSTVFSEKESIIFSRSYAIFVTDKIIAYSIKDKLWTADDYDEADFISRAEEHLNKLELLDKMYYGNYFKRCEYKQPL